MEELIRLFNKPESAFKEFIRQDLSDDELYEWKSYVMTFRDHADEILEKIIKKYEDDYYAS